MGRLLLRLAIGGFFVGHGTQKLFGWFGGAGPDATGGFFESLGLRPGRRHALAAGTAEAGGGTLLAAGLATPFAAASLVGVMVTAIRTVHWKNGPWASNGGYEYNAVLIAALLALVELGPGELSLDAALGIETRGTGWMVTALAAGTLGSLAATATSAPAPPTAPGADGEPA
jgi:putative oxidoreductase